MRRVISSWFGSGLVLGRIRDSHSGSGTVGAGLALGVSLVIGQLFGLPGQIAAMVLVTATGAWAIAPFVAEEGDAGWIVVDEAAGTFLATLGLTFSPAAFVAFAVFRAADIFKRSFPGVSAAERLPGPVGVMADDLVAGVYGLVVGQTLSLLLQ